MSPARILVWLEGGGDCGTKDVCDERRLDEEHPIEGWLGCTSCDIHVAS